MWHPRKQNVPTALSLCSGNPHDPEIEFVFAEIFDDFILIVMKLSETNNFQISLENIIS